MYLYGWRMVSKMKKALLYIGSFIVSWVISFTVIALFLGLLVLIVMFIVWSWPVASPFTWGIFRLISGIATIFSIIWSFSKENKQFVNDTLEGKV